ncbi:MAG: hypothetical protein JXR78_06175 [Victivallales bacterium]|nr:hypothetical protein [Victivallales bacterium]
MKKLLSAVFTLVIANSVMANLPASRARIDVSSNKKFELFPVEGGNMTNIIWGNQEDRKFAVFGQSGNLSEDKWMEVKFSFMSDSDGIVSLTLRGMSHRSKDKKNRNILWVIYDAVEINGAKIKNGNFSKARNNRPTSWSGDHTLYITEGEDFKFGAAGVKSWHDKTFRQNIAVKKGEKVTITVYAKSGGAEEATE